MVRHAEATVVRVVVSVELGQVTILVADDGVGIPADAKRSGLENLSGRAQRCGGTFQTRRNEPRGTVVEWRVPL